LSIEMHFQLISIFFPDECPSIWKHAFSKLSCILICHIDFRLIFLHKMEIWFCSRIMFLKFNCSLICTFTSWTNKWYNNTVDSNPVIYMKPNNKRVYTLCSRQHNVFKGVYAMLSTRACTLYVNICYVVLIPHIH